jgi:hypothetical protein
MKAIWYIVACLALATATTAMVNAAPKQAASDANEAGLAGCSTLAGSLATSVQIAGRHDL